MNIPGWDKLDEEQRALVEWRYRLCGDFKRSLWAAIVYADDDNLELLRRGFPLEVSAFMKYQRQSDYWKNAVKLAGGDVEAGY